MKLSMELNWFGYRWSRPDLDLLACSWVNDGDVGVGVGTVTGVEVVVHVLLSTLIILCILHEDEVLSHSCLDIVILPDIPVKALAVEDCRVLDVDKQPLFFVLAHISRLFPRSLVHDLKRWSE